MTRDRVGAVCGLFRLVAGSTQLLTRRAALGKYGKLLANPYGYWREQRDRRSQKRKMYRKMLLLNKREREAAFHDKDTVFAPSSDKVERNSKGLAVVDNLEYKK